MENYVERSLSGASGIPAHEMQALQEKGALSDGAVVRGEIVRRRARRDDPQLQTLSEILAQKDFDDPVVAASDAAVEESTARVRSIIGFPMLLQHVLRIWLFKRGRADLPRILDQELIALFQRHFSDANADASEQARADDVRAFIDLLWRVRVLFDEHVIKWVDQGSQFVHVLSRLGASTHKSRSYIHRSRDTDSHRGLSLLQSMLYHSQEITTQYWLTPFLLHLLDERGRGVNAHFEYLRHLDNHLLGSSPDQSLVVRTHSFMTEPWQERLLIHRVALTEQRGVSFAHYWFYKLEFVLWHQNSTANSRWRDFRFTARNSVEHISPQTPTERDPDRVGEMLDYFGNLALVSRSVNSEYGNMPFNEKRRRFLNFNAESADSLKMDAIYHLHEHWSDTIARAHQDDMIEQFDAYVASCRTQDETARP